MRFLPGFLPVINGNELIKRDVISIFDSLLHFLFFHPKIFVVVFFFDPTVHFFYTIPIINVKNSRRDASPPPEYAIPEEKLVHESRFFLFSLTRTFSALLLLTQFCFAGFLSFFLIF